MEPRPAPRRTCTNLPTRISPWQTPLGQERNPATPIPAPSQKTGLGISKRVHDGNGNVYVYHQNRRGNPERRDLSTSQLACPGAVTNGLRSISAIGGSVISAIINEGGNAYARHKASSVDHPDLGTPRNPILGTITPSMHPVQLLLSLSGPTQVAPLTLAATRAGIGTAMYLRCTTMGHTTIQDITPTADLTAQRIHPMSRAGEGPSLTAGPRPRRTTSWAAVVAKADRRRQRRPDGPGGDPPSDDSSGLPMYPFPDGEEPPSPGDPDDGPDDEVEERGLRPAKGVDWRYFDIDIHHPEAKVVIYRR